MAYDSKVDTLLHIKRVSQLLTEASSELIKRANNHDNSKLESPEKELFDKYTPKLKETTYGSDEYKDFLKGLKVALDHHYENNSHHPEHYKNGVNGMNLFDLIEMFFDWKAAGERHADGNIYKSIEINKERFGLSEQIVDIFANTANYLGYDKDTELIELMNRLRELSDKKYPNRKWTDKMYNSFKASWKDRIDELRERVTKLESELK